MPLSSVKPIKTKADLATEVRRLVLAHERRIGRPVKKAVLAKAVGVSASSLYAYLNGTTLPATDTFDRLLDVIDVPAPERRRLSTARDELDVHGRVAPEVARSPRELPPDVFGFTGRAEQLAELDRVLAGPGEQVISAVSGMAGVGKTALVVRWAHRVRDRFPDGQLYVDLRGYDPDRPVQPAEVLAAFLRSLGVGGDLPPGLAQRAARYRTLLADRRMLIVLDNAHATDQIRDLLPGTPSCFVVVTSRDRLAGLVARYGAHRLDLDLLPPADAIALLRTLIGERVDVEPKAAAALAQCCVHLPIALRIAAELAAIRPTVSLADLAAELGQHRLDMFGVGGDERTAVRSVFSWSYRHLPADAAKAFRLLGLHPGYDIEPYAMAALADSDPDTAHLLLGALRCAHLVQETGLDRYGMHDLLRSYAAEQAGAPSETTNHAALTRLFDYYTHTASVVTDLVYPQDRARGPRIPPPSTPCPEFADQTQAVAWLDAERANLLATARHATDHGWPRHINQLSRVLARHLRTRAHYSDALTLHTSALRTARDTGDRTELCHALASLGEIYRTVGQFDQALGSYREALDIARDTGDRLDECHALTGLGDTCARIGQYDQALERYREALDIARDTGDRAGERHALTGLGFVRRIVGQYGQALDHLQQAQRIARDIADRTGERHALIGLGDVYRLLARYDQALECYREALDIAHDVGDRDGESYALGSMGNIYRMMGHHDQALDHHRRALTIARDIGDRYSEGYELSSLGADYNLLAEYDQALDHHRQALTIFRDIGDRNGQFEALNGIGNTLRATGRPNDALSYHRDAAVIAQEIGQKHDYACALDGIGHAHHDLDQPDQARQHWQQALEIFAELGTPAADELRRRLAALNGPSPSKEYGR